MIFQVQFYKLDKFGWSCLGFSTEESAAYLLNRRLARILPLRFGCESQVVMWPLLAQKQLNSFWWTALWGTRDNTNWFEPHYQPQKSIICHFSTQRKKKKACASHWHSQDILNDFRHQQHISVHPVVMWWLSELLRDFFFLFCFSFPENISSCSAEVLPAFLLLNSPPTQQSLFQKQPELLAARAREKEQWPGREKHWHYTFFPDIFFSSFLSSRPAT